VETILRKRGFSTGLDAVATGDVDPASRGFRRARGPRRPDRLSAVPRDRLQAWAKAAEGDVPLQAEDDDDPSAMIDKGVSMLHAFYEQAGIPEVVAVEHSFAITLHDVDTGEPLEEQLVGTMDLLIREESRVVVVEHKTAARKYTEDQLRCDFQPTGYQIAARESGLGDVASRFQIVTKTKVPAVQVTNIHRDERDEQDFLRTAGGVLRAIDAGVSYPLRGWRCRGCPYESACKQPARAVVQSAA